MLDFHNKYLVAHLKGFHKKDDCNLIRYLDFIRFTNYI
jgi:hypothetical protein